MPFKKMTLREQREAKRELKRLRRLDRDIHSQYSGTRIAEGELCDHAGGAIAAALKLGFVVVVRGHPQGGKRLVAAAYKLGA
jgi:hypothetical protein